MNEADVVNLGLDEDDVENVMGIAPPQNVPHLDQDMEHLDMPDLNNVMAAAVAEFYNPPLDYDGCRYNYQPERLEQ